MKRFWMFLKGLFIKPAPVARPEAKVLPLGVTAEAAGYRYRRLNQMGGIQEVYVPGTVLLDDPWETADWLYRSGLTQDSPVDHVPQQRREQVDFNGGDFGGGGAEDNYSPSAPDNDSSPED